MAANETHQFNQTRLTNLAFPDFVNENLETIYMISLQLLEQIYCSEVLTLDNLVWAIYFVIAVVLWYYLFWKPFDWYRDFTGLGYDEIHRFSKQKYGTEASKRDAINNLRAKREMGDLPPVYPNGWFVILESDQLEAKSAKEVSVLGLNLVAWRGESGKSYVADAYCPHLGAHLGVGGKVSGECIKCPFHGWAFHGEDGKLNNIPYSESVMDFAKIKIWTTVEMNGFIYLWYHAEGSPPNWFPERFPLIDSGDWKYRGRSEYLTSCHIQDVQENGADVNHFESVHEVAFMAGGQPDNAWTKWDFVKHNFKADWKVSEVPGEEHVAYNYLQHQMFVVNKFPLLQVNLEVKQLGPSLVSMEYNTGFGKGVLFFSVTPQEPMVQRIVKRFYTESTIIHPYAKLILLGEAIMLERDICIWNRKLYINRPLLSKEDKTIKAFRRWYSQYYSENSPRHYFPSSDKSQSKLDF